MTFHPSLQKNRIEDKKDDEDGRIHNCGSLKIKGVEKEKLCTKKMTRVGGREGRKEGKIKDKAI